MTPKNKADELVGKYKGQILTITPRPNRPNYQSKQCALIAVDLKLEGMIEECGDPITFWQQVRKEIESL